MKLTASVVGQALEKKYKPKHLTWREVKNGPSWCVAFGGRRIDFLAIKKTWSPITIVAAEIKVSRSDFTGDDKWPAYMDLCNQFYWACPKGLISTNEIDPRCGLLTVNPETQAVRTVKRAPYRDVAPDSLLLLYLLFWRHDTPEPEDINAVIRREIEADAELGDRYRRFVSRKLSAANERVREVEARSKAANRSAFTLLKWMKENEVSDWQLENLLDAAKELRLMRGAERQLRGAASTMQGLVTAMDKLKATEERGKL